MENADIIAGCRVCHIKDGAEGEVISVDDNLEYPTTCQVIWDDDTSKVPDIQWTNKLTVLERE